MQTWTTKYPDDDRFRIYRVYAKHSDEGSDASFPTS